MISQLDAALAQAFGPAVAGSEPAVVQMVSGRSPGGVAVSVGGILNSARTDLFDPVINTALEAVSDDINDTLAGTGAQIVRATGIDANNAVVTEDFEMDGVTPVVGSQVFKALNDVRAIQVGSDARNRGTINLSKTAVDYAEIVPDLVAAQLGTFCVPAGKLAVPFCLSQPIYPTFGADTHIWTIGAFTLNTDGLRTFLASAGIKRPDRHLHEPKAINRRVLVQPGGSILLTMLFSNTSKEIGGTISYILMNQPS
jgi:hypothetical protein